MNQYFPADQKHVHIYGRTKVQNPLPIFWTASGIEFQTTASEVWVTVEAFYEHKEIWIQIEIDGFLLQRMMLPRGKHDLCLFREFPEQEKTIRILQSAQPFSDDEKRLLLIHEIQASAPLKELSPKSFAIEVIGDSLSSGEGLSGTNAYHGWSAGLFGITGHYARRVADYFHADLRIISQSGWGFCSAWDNNPNHCIPAYYHQICGLLKGENQIQWGALEEYDFNSYKPDVIIINLGTNDGFATIGKPWTAPVTGEVWQLKREENGELTEASFARMQSAMISFLKEVRRCNHNSYIIWAYGMCGYLMKKDLLQIFHQYVEETNDTKAEFVLLPEMKKEQLGANEHPGVLDHRDSAEVLIEKIRLQFRD